MKFDMFGQGKRPAKGPPFVPKLDQNTFYDLVNVMHSHLFEHRNQRKVHFLRTFFFAVVFHHQTQNHSFMKRFFTLIAAAMTFMVSGWSQNTVVDIIVDSPDHTVLETAVATAGLVETLSGEGPFTVFAPTDAAFTALLETLGASAEDLLSLAELTQILTYHVAGVNALSTDLTDGPVTTVNGQDVTIAIMDGTVMINGTATVTMADITADNGVVHVIDAVLVPAVITGCTDAMACNYSPVATDDDMSCELPGDLCDDENWLTENDTLNADCECVGADIQFGTVVDIVVSSPIHTLLEAAVLEADLDSTLAATDSLTVFAPTDDAISALATALGTDAAGILALPNLANILTYHVVGAIAMSTDLSDGQQITTLQGSDVSVTITGDTVMINQAMVTVADLVAGNGVVHVIDAVLLTEGCTNADACNYDPLALVDDASCLLPGDICDDENWLTENDTLNADCECAGADIQFGTVVDIVVASPIHELLEAAVLAADLAGALSEGDSLTVFAPTDDAITAFGHRFGHHGRRFVGAAQLGGHSDLPRCGCCCAEHRPQ